MGHKCTVYSKIPRCTKKETPAKLNLRVLKFVNETYLYAPLHEEQLISRYGTYFH